MNARSASGIGAIPIVTIGPLAALYVPADRPDRFAKALASAADAVILDLEDAVAPAAKAAARANAVRLTAALTDKPVQIRINSLTSPWWQDDLAALSALATLSALAVLPSGQSPHAGLAGVRIPKVESPEQVRLVAALLGHDLPLHPLIESARGVEAAFDIARAHLSVAAIALGEADLTGDLGVGDESGLLWARARIVVAARAASLPPPAMSVYPRLDDDEGLYGSCVAGRSAGFLGRTVIHPKQIPTVLRAFTPSEAEIDAATATLDALAGAELMEGGTAVLADGRFVDRAMALAAARILALRDAAQRRRPGTAQDTGNGSDSTGLGSAGRER